MTARADATNRPRQTFSRSQRLRRRTEFLHVQESGARVTTRHLLILLVPRPDGQPTRLGVVASRKVGGAVERNRAKRLLREVFRKNLATFPLHTDVVIITRPGTHELDERTLEAEIRAVAPLLEKRAKSRSSGTAGKTPFAKPQRGRP